MTEMLDPAMWSLVRAATLDALSQGRKMIQEGKKPRNYHQYPEFSSSSSGAFRKVTWSRNTPDYSSLFGAQPSSYMAPYVDYSELNEFDQLLDHVKQSSDLVEYLSFPSTNDNPRHAAHVLRVQVADLPLSIMDRHAHIKGWEPDEEFIRSSYQELETWWFERELPFEYVIPILGATFDSDGFLIRDDVRVERMADDDQLVRWPSDAAFGRNSPIESVLSYATHALVVGGLKLHSPSALGWLGHFDLLVPEEPTSTFFQVLSVVGDGASGYAYGYARPVKWSHGYHGRLTNVSIGEFSTNYPDALNLGLAEPTCEIDSHDAARLVEYFGRVEDSSKETRLALRRLVTAGQRKDAADQILDLCIGVESLVSDSSPGDTTYKLALRTAAVLALRGFRTDVVFKAVKQIYAYRSAIAHGSADASKKSQVKIADSEVHAIHVARIFLRSLLMAFLEDRELSPTVVDTRCILDMISAGVEASATKA